MIEHEGKTSSFEKKKESKERICELLEKEVDLLI